MSEAVRQLTPVEVARAELFRFLEEKELILNDEMKDGICEIFLSVLDYETQYQSDRFKVSDMNVRAYKEENQLLKTQLRVLTKYIDGHNI